MSKQPVENIFAALDRVKHTDRVDAFTMPGEFYTSEEFLDIEREQLFRHQWICLGREEEVPAVGDYFATDLTGEPVIIVRSSSVQIKALSNVCRHRAMPLVQGSGNTRRFTCSYHAWSYDLDGRLLRARGLDAHHNDFIGACKLPRFKCETWHGFIFVNLDADAASLVDSESMRGLEPRVKNMHMEDMRLIYSSEQEWNTNWKCLVENFMEGYHLSTVHRDTLHPFTPTRLSRHIETGQDYFGFYSGYPDDAPARGRAHPDLSEDEMRRSFMLCIPPCSVFGISGFKVTYNLIQPLSATTMRTKIGLIGRLSESDDDQKKQEVMRDMFTSTFAEDEVQLVKIMRGLQSRFYDSSYLARPDYEGTIWDFYNYMARTLKKINSDTIK